MSNSVTLYVVESKGSETRDLKRNQQNLINELNVKEVIGVEGGVDFSELNPSTDWKMFIYDNEVISEQLLAGIPIFLQEGYDVLVFYKTKEELVFVCPRIFRSLVKLRRDALMPDSYEGLRVTRILNGFVFEENHDRSHL